LSRGGKKIKAWILRKTNPYGGRGEEAAQTERPRVKARPES
jgi:hypothetical protein